MMNENELEVANLLLERVEAEKNRADELANMIRVILQEFSQTKTIRRETFEFADFMITHLHKGEEEE
tara:strand:- start:4998 stop:5198 length:201 start_codon:yes stop_codon:yes gene_type:complete